MQRAANVSYPNESGCLVGGGQTATDSNRCIAEPPYADRSPAIFGRWPPSTPQPV